MAGSCEIMFSAPPLVALLPLKSKPLQIDPEAGHPRDGAVRGYNLGNADIRAASEKQTLTDLSQVSTPGRLSNPPCTLAFVYGTLKKGFSNYWLMEDAMGKGHARFVGVARTRQKFPLVCGPFQVPFLLNIPSCGCHVRGELYEVDRSAVELLDELEGVSKGHYQRSPIALTGLQLQQFDFPLGDIEAEAYFAASSFTEGLSRAPHLESYTAKETVTYVKRKDRPQGPTFLELVRAWIDAQESALNENRVLPIG